MLHWSFPGPDRRALNWLWHALKRDEKVYTIESVNLPQGAWLHVFSFVGRGWRTLAAVGDQNDRKQLAASGRKH